MDAKYISLSFYEFAWMGAELQWHSSDLLTAGMEYNDLMGVSIAWLLFSLGGNYGQLHEALNALFIGYCK